jgi:hypothetical protein
MANRVDATNHRVQPAQRKPMPDRSLTESHCPELATGDHPVLLCGERGDPALDATWLSFGLYVGLNLSHVRSQADEMCRVTRGS